MGRHRGDFAEGRERGQRIKVLYSSILFLGFNSFSFWLGHDLGRGLGLNLVGLNEAHGAWLGRVQAPEKKIRLVNGPGPGRGSWPAGRVRVCKNPARNRPVAIPSCPQREFSNQTSPLGTQLVNSLFKEPVYQILEKIKNEPYFKWPNKIGGDLSGRNQNLYYHYHQDRGHTTEDCRTLQDHLSQLVKVGKLNQFLH